MTFLRLIPAAATHKGMRRRHNEDSIGYEYPSNPEILLSHGALFIVADGVGGLSSGDKASQMTVEQLIRRYYESDAALSVEQRLAEAIQDVNYAVYSTLNRVGATTVVAVVIIGERLVAAAAGDSQIFRITDGAISQINEEDVLHSDDADDGALTKAIGYREDIEIETVSGTLQANDKILLCSDGLTRYLNVTQLLQLSQLRDPRDSVRRMINQANTSGGADNISALLIHVGEPIAAEDIDAHLKRISIRVAVDADPMMLQDVDSKPTTHMPLSRPETVIDEALLGSPDLPKRPNERIPTPIHPTQAQTTPISQGNNNTIIIVAAVIVLALGALIVGIAIASLGNESTPIPSSGITEENLATSGDTSTPESTVDDPLMEIQINDYILFDEATLTKNNIASDVGSFLASANTVYLITNITEDSEGQLWYLLLEEETNQTGWLAESDLAAYTLQRE